MQMTTKDHAVLTKALESATRKAERYERLALHYEGLRKPLDAEDARAAATYHAELASALTTVLECADPVDDDEGAGGDDDACRELRGPLRAGRGRCRC